MKEPVEEQGINNLLGEIYPQDSILKNQILWHSGISLVLFHSFLFEQAHPGCGLHAGGKGYNSRGNFCVGWAGNCGDGGVGGSSWYLVCENCRDKYLQARKQSSAKKTTRKKATIIAPSTVKLSSPASDIPGQLTYCSATTI